MQEGKSLTAGVLCAARRLLKSGVRIEKQLASTLFKCDRIGDRVCQAVSVTLTKLVQDIAGTPLVFAEYVADPKAMRCILTVLHVVLSKVRPDQFETHADLLRGQDKARAVCRAHNLPEVVQEMAAVLVHEIAETFQQLDVVLQPPFVQKSRNARILRDRVKNFLRAVHGELFIVAYASMKLAVCMRELSEGCFEMRKGDKRLIEDLLHQVRTKARTVATLNETHRGNIVTASLMAARRR